MEIILPLLPILDDSIEQCLIECKVYVETIEKYLQVNENLPHSNLQELSDAIENITPITDEIDEKIFNYDMKVETHEYSVEAMEGYSHQMDDLRIKISELEERIEKAIKRCAEDNKNQGNTCFKEGDYTTALKKYQEAIHIDSYDPVYYTNAALALQKLEKWVDSIEYCNKALDIDSTFLKGYIIRTKSFLAQNNIHGAAESLSNIPNSYESQHDVIELRQALSGKAKDVGNVYFKEGNYDQALTMYTMAINFDSQNHLLYSNRSACYQAKRAWKEAKDDALQVIDLNDKFPKGYIHLIRCQIKLSEYDHAMSSLSDAINSLSTLSEWLTTIKSQFDELATEITTTKAAALARSTNSDKSRGESLKQRGNQLYQNGEYQDAIRYYSQAIGACPEEGTYFGNRAACWMMLKEYQQVFNDCNQGLVLEKQPGDLDKLRLRLLDALTHMGKIDEGLAFIGEYNRKRKNGEDGSWFKGSTSFQEKYQALQTIKTNMENAKKALDNNEFSRAKRLFEQVVAAGVTEDIQILISLAKSHLGLKELEDAAKFSQQAITISGTKGGLKSIEAYIVRAEALAGQGLTEQSCKYYSAAVQLDPDNQVAIQRLKILRKVLSDTVSIRKRIGEAMAERKYDAAIVACGEGLQIDRTCMKLMAEMHYKRAQAYQMLGKVQARNPSSSSASSSSIPTEAAHVTSLKKCLQDSNSALYYDKVMIDAFYMKIEALQTLNRHEEAVSELEQLVSEKSYRNDEIAHEKLKQAKLLLKRSLRKDLYQILMVERGNLASDEEIRKAYKKAALKWHPDRHSSGTEEKKKEAESKFKEIQGAFELLTDPQKRRLYDQGYDEDEIEQKLEAERQYSAYGGGYHSHGGGRGHYGYH